MRLLNLSIGAFLARIAGWNTALAQSEVDPERGGELYVENCAVCHGVEGKGRIGANLENIPAIDVGLILEPMITNGVAGTVMPAQGRANGGPLSDQDIADISAYIQGAFAGSDPIAPAPTYIAPAIDRLPDIDGNQSAGRSCFSRVASPAMGTKVKGASDYRLRSPGLAISRRFISTR